MKIYLKHDECGFITTVLTGNNLVVQGEYNYIEESAKEELARDVKDNPREYKIINSKLVNIMDDDLS